MSKLKKVSVLMLLCIKKPKVFFKGLVYFIKYGAHGFKENAKGRANYELTSDKYISPKKHENLVSIIIRVDDPNFDLLNQSVESIILQEYSGIWDINIISSQNDFSKLKTYEKIYSNITVHVNKSNINEIDFMNSVISSVKGKYIWYLKQGDMLNEKTLNELYNAYRHNKPEIIYGDHIYMDEKGIKKDPVLKPDWSPDLLTSIMYVGNAFCFKKSLFNEISGFQSEFNESILYDLLLRLSEKAKHISHISYPILVTYKSVETKKEAPVSETGKLSVQQHVDRVYGNGYAKVDVDEVGYDVRYKLESNTKVSIIIPTKDHADDLQIALDSIYSKSTYKNFEIIILNNNSIKKETFEYFDRIQQEHDNIIVEEASYSFNWSKLNNHGIRKASGDVFIFLNNDIKVISEDWMERLSENAMRTDAGVVGSLLLYPDNTIQHCGVVIGLNDWSDHLYKGMKLDQSFLPFISPLVTRNVMACTGACYAISRNTINKIGLFNENFIICGSDIDICVRAHKTGLKNIYLPKVKLYHYESKSRDSYIPEIDFIMSAKSYSPYREVGDPFFNKLLDHHSCEPNLSDAVMAGMIGEEITNVSIVEATEYQFRKVDFPEKRLNVIVPTINPEYVFGGISTAIKFFDSLADKLGYSKRIILSEAEPNEGAIKQYKDSYTFVGCDDNSNDKNQIVSYSNRNGKKLPVSENDYFIFTAWWTAYCIQEAYSSEFSNAGLRPNILIYLIQDYEPGFYPWSTRYLLADSTYKSDHKQIAVYNSHWLREFFELNGYHFYSEVDFDPIFNSTLKNRLEQIGNSIHKKKQILIYGRPEVARNAFELIVEALKKWVKLQSDIEEWDILSAGEQHKPIYLGRGKMLHSIGKLTIDEYAKLLEESYAGISLMVSPHPSYPPLEMATYGVKVITNQYANKDLGTFSDNIISLDDASARNIALHLHEVCTEFTPVIEVNVNKEYYDNKDNFKCLDEIEMIINQESSAN